MLFVRCLPGHMILLSFRSISFDESLYNSPINQETGTADLYIHLINDAHDLALSNTRDLGGTETAIIKFQMNVKVEI